MATINTEELWLSLKDFLEKIGCTDVKIVDLKEQEEKKPMAKISIDNGRNLFGPDELDEFFWTVNVRCSEQNCSYGSIWCNIVSMMDDEIREKVHAEIDPDHDDQSFLRRYLELSPEDLIIG